MKVTVSHNSHLRCCTSTSNVRRRRFHLHRLAGSSWGCLGAPCHWLCWRKLVFCAEGDGFGSYPSVLLEVLPSLAALQHGIFLSLCGRPQGYLKEERSNPAAPCVGIHFPWLGEHAVQLVQGRSQSDLPTWRLAWKTQTTNFEFGRTNDVSTQVSSKTATPCTNVCLPAVHPPATGATCQLRNPDTNRLVRLENSRQVQSGSAACCRDSESRCALDLTEAFPGILSLTSSPLVPEKCKPFVSRQHVSQVITGGNLV